MRVASAEAVCARPAAAKASRTTIAHDAIRASRIIYTPPYVGVSDLITSTSAGRAGSLPQREERPRVYHLTPPCYPESRRMFDETPESQAAPLPAEPLHSDVAAGRSDVVQPDVVQADVVQAFE